MNIKNMRKNLGFTLVEILLVVGFISLAGIGIYATYSKVQRSNSALQEIKNLSLFKYGIKNLYGNSQNYAGLSNAVINNARITPDSLRALPYAPGDTIISNSFGGGVNVWASNWNGATNNVFIVQYSGVPVDACVKMIMSAQDEWDQIAIGAAIPIKSPGINLNSKVSASLATTQCSQYNSGNGLSVQFWSR